MGKNREADRLRLQFALLARRLLPILLVKEFMRQLMDYDSAACGCGKRFLDLDRPTFADSLGCALDGFVDKLDSQRDGRSFDSRQKLLAAFSGIRVNLWQWFAIGLLKRLSRDLRPGFHALDTARGLPQGDSHGCRGKWLLCRPILSREGSMDCTPRFAFATHEV